MSGREEVWPGSSFGEALGLTLSQTVVSVSIREWAVDGRVNGSLPGMARLSEGMTRAKGVGRAFRSPTRLVSSPATSKWKKEKGGVKKVEEIEAGDSVGGVVGMLVVSWCEPHWLQGSFLRKGGGGHC